MPVPSWGRHRANSQHSAPALWYNIFWPPVALNGAAPPGGVNQWKRRFVMPFGLFEKPPQLVMTVDRPQGPYYPGDVVHVTLQVHAEKATKINEVRAVL